MGVNGEIGVNGRFFELKIRISLLYIQLYILLRFMTQENRRLRRAEAESTFPKVAGLNLPDSIVVVVEELNKLGVSADSELEFLEEEDFKKLSLKPVSRGKIKRLAEAIQGSMPQQPPQVAGPLHAGQNFPSWLPAEPAQAKAPVGGQGRAQTRQDQQPPPMAEPKRPELKAS